MHYGLLWGCEDRSHLPHSISGNFMDPVMWAVTKKQRLQPLKASSGEQVFIKTDVSYFPISWHNLSVFLVSLSHVSSKNPIDSEMFASMSCHNPGDHCVGPSVLGSEAYAICPFWTFVLLAECDSLNVISFIPCRLWIASTSAEGTESLWLLSL